MRTLPDPETDHGRDAILALCMVLGYHKALSGVANPYGGEYYLSDMRCFKCIVTHIAKSGSFESQNLNLYGGYRQMLNEKLKVKQIVMDDRWTCAGLAEFLVHVGRAIIHLACLWYQYTHHGDDGIEFNEDDEDQAGDEPEDFGDSDNDSAAELDLEENPDAWLRPKTVRRRVISDLADALGFTRKVAAHLIGSLVECKNLKNKDLVPQTFWRPNEDKTGRPPSLWDAYFQTRMVSKSQKSGNDADGESDGMDEA